MKLYQRFFIALAALSLGVLGLVQRADAQGAQPTWSNYTSQNAQQFGVQPIWANYTVQVVNEFYNPLGQQHLLSADGFRNFSGQPDHDDGTYDSIQTGFTFNFNGNEYSSFNVNVNGWVTIGNQPTPVTPANNNNLFSSVLPNNCFAPYWGDHYYRTTEPGYTPSTISYWVSSVPATSVDPNSQQFKLIHTVTVEWRNLNVNDKNNPNSIASFQFIIRENPKAWDLAAPDDRATFEFQYGPIGTNGTVQTVGASVGANDSVGFTHINALYTSDNLDSVRYNTVTRTSCWPPTAGISQNPALNPTLCLPGRAIQFVPNGVALLNQWGDGDVMLLQLNSTDAQVRANQSLFVQLQDAMLILEASSNDIPLDSIEGRAAFHGDANHNGRGYHDAQGVFHPNQFDPNFGAYFYFTTPYDAAYIMMYLAGKLAELPWPIPLPVPGYKAADIHITDVSGVSADVSNIQTTGSTILVPIVIHGEVNGPLSVEMNLKGLESSGLEFVGTRSSSGTLVASNAKLGRIALATSGTYTDGQTVAYLELRAPANANGEFDMTNVKVNDADVPSSHVALKLGSAGSASVSSLEQNVPNPFVVSTSNETTIPFELSAPEVVTVRVFDMLGHEVRTLVDGEGRAAGMNTVAWDGRDANGNEVSSGLYYYQLVTPDFTKTEKMQVVR